MNPCQLTTKGSTRAGVNLNSGSPLTASTVGFTRAPTRASEAVAPFQWMGTKIDRRGISPLVRRRTTIRPQRVATRTRAPSPKPNLNASAGCMSTNGSGRWLPRRGERPVRVMVCH